jgi:signal peptidase II
MSTAEATGRPTSARSPTSPRLRRALFLGTAALVVALDQATKALIRASIAPGDSWPEGWPVQLSHVTNSGAAFGILKDQTGFLIVTTVVGLAAIYLYYRFPPFDHAVAPIAIGLMLGGAVGNLVDRVRLGEVTDFIDFGFWPSFNVADSAITVGIVSLLLGYAFFSGRPPPEPGRDEAGADGG